MDAKISVIIPVYNAEAYLDKCVGSIVEFMTVNGMDYEVIMVDDGSRDRSGEICDRLGFTVIHQENQGVSAARNAGLDIATGDYVWFVDADDYVIVSSFKSQVSGSADLVVLGFVWDENGVAKSFGASKDEIPYNLWRCWFSRKVIEDAGLRFTIGRKYAEDQEFILRIMIASHKLAQIGTNNIAAIDKPIYYYTLRPGSAMTKKGVKAKKVKDVAAVLIEIFFLAIAKGAITQRWVWHELKRMTKSLYVTIKASA